MSNLVPQFAKLTINDDRPIDDTSDDDRNRIFVSTVPPILALPKGCLYSTLSSDALISQFLSNTVVPTKSVKGRLNIKKNLTPAEIGPVASSLITGDSIPFLINNFQFIFAVWMLFLTSKTLSRSADQAVIEAFDVLHELLTDKRDTRFLLRFAYVQLAEAIDALVKAAKENRHAGHLYKRDESVYIDVYLTAKGNPLKSPKLRNKLSEHKRMGRRWRQLTDPSPLLLFLYSDNAESVVQNTSIELGTLNSLVAEVKQIYSNLVPILVSLAQEGELAIESGVTPSIGHLQDTIIQLLGFVPEGTL